MKAVKKVKQVEVRVSDPKSGGQKGMKAAAFKPTNPKDMIGSNKLLT